jgi:hypothetical protein
MRNYPLVCALRAHELTATDLAAALQVAPKTVQRWIADQTCIPRAATRSRVAEHLGVPGAQLWRTSGADRQAHSHNELVALYPARSAVPAALIGELMAGATDRIDILALSANYLRETVDGLIPALIAGAAAGVAVRILLADPEGDAVSVRGVEEGLGELVRARAQLAWAAVSPLADVPGIELGMHDTTLYATVLRADDDLLVNVHVFGVPASSAPVMHVRRQQGGRLSETYLSSVDRVADLSRPYGFGTAAARSRRISRPRVLRPVGQSGA